MEKTIKKVANEYYSCYIADFDEETGIARNDMKLMRKKLILDNWTFLKVTNVKTKEKIYVLHIFQGFDKKGRPYFGEHKYLFNRKAYYEICRLNDAGFQNGLLVYNDYLEQILEQMYDNDIYHM